MSDQRNKTTLKLSKQQRAMLIQSALGNGVSAVDSYAPIQRLLALGLVARTGRRMSNPLFRITDAGRKELANG